MKHGKAEYNFHIEALKTYAKWYKGDTDEGDTDEIECKSMILRLIRVRASRLSNARKCKRAKSCAGH